MKDAIITVRVSRKVKEELAKYKVNVSENFNTVAREIRRKQREELEMIAAQLGKFFEEIPDEEIVESIREMRGSR